MQMGQPGAIHRCTVRPANVLDINPLMDLAVRLRYQVARRVDKGVGGGDEEEVAPQQLAGLEQPLLGLFKVKVDVQRLDEVRHGIAVLVVLLLHDADQVLEVFLILARVAASAPVRDDGGG